MYKIFLTFQLKNKIKPKQKKIVFACLKLNLYNLKYIIFVIFL